MDDDQLSRVFAALADPTRRDMVARLAVGDATVGELAEPYDVSVQAVSKHIKVLSRCRPGEPAQGRATAAVPPRGGGLRPDDEVDRALPPAGPGALRAPRRRPGRDARRANPPNPNRTTRSSIMNATSHRYQASIEADPTLPIIRMTRDFDATPGAADAGPHRSRALRPLGRTQRHGDQDHRLGRHHRRPLALRRRPRRRGVRLPRLLPRGRRRPHRPDLHLRRTAGRRLPRDPVGSRTSATAAPACTPSRSSTASRAATSGWPAAWRPASTRATPSSTP